MKAKQKYIHKDEVLYLSNNIIDKLETIKEEIEYTIKRIREAEVKHKIRYNQSYFKELTEL